jgi:hypothetical protein
MNGDRHRAAYLPVRCDVPTAELIAKLAKEQKRDRSDVLRELLDRGLKNVGARPEDDRLYGMVRAAVSEVMKPYVERLAAISAKATQISGANFFMQVYLGGMLLPEGDRQVMEEVAARARKLGIEYLKLKRDADIDEFIARGAMKMKDE